MKRHILSLTMLMACAIPSAFGQTQAPAPTPTPAEELRIYINPGHGSWGSSDRPLKVYKEVDGVQTTLDPKASTSTPDTTAFFETNTNLWKGLALLQELQKLNITFNPEDGKNNTSPGNDGAARNLTQNIVMSRTKNGIYGSSSTVYNRNLSEICQEVQSNNFDVFISIHSNALSSDNGTSNYHLILYRGFNNPSTSNSSSTLTLTHQKVSKAISEAVFNHSSHLPYQNWTTDNVIRGDLSFQGTASAQTTDGAYGWYGALRHQVPGFLVEGYFHSYGPSRHRAMNPDVDHMEAVLYARGIADYFGLPYSGEGNIYGIIRDKEETFSDTQYTPKSGTNDCYKPINGATVRLYKENSDQVFKDYTTDNYYNGAFVFKGLAPGNYTIEVEKTGYIPYTQPVTVQADKETLPEIFLTKNDYVESMATEFDRKTISQLTGCTEIKRMIARGNYVYILGLDSSDEPHLVVYDHVNEQAYPISTTGCSGSFKVLSDIAVTSDGVLIGINQTQQVNPSSDKGVKIYKWSNDADGKPTGDPSVWIQLNTTGNYSYAKPGYSMTYIGSSTTGQVFFTAHTNYCEYKNETPNTDNTFRLVAVPVSGGTGGNTSYFYKTNEAGAHPTLISTFGDVRLLNWTSNNRPFVNGSLKDMVLYKVTNSSTSTTTETGTGQAPTSAHVVQLKSGLIDPSALNIDIFKLNGDDHLLAPDISGGMVTGFKIYNIEQSVLQPTAVSTPSLALPTAMPFTSATVATAGCAVTVADPQDPSVTYNGYALFCLAGDKLTKIQYKRDYDETRTETVDDTKNPFDPNIIRPEIPKVAPVAYHISSEGGPIGGYDLTYTLSEDALNVYVKLIDIDTDEEIEINVNKSSTLKEGDNFHAPLTDDNTENVNDSFTKGVNRIHLSNEHFPNGSEYRWKLIVEGPEIPVGGEVLQTSPWDKYNVSGTNHLNGVTVEEIHGGVQVIQDHNSPMYGYIVAACGRGNGFALYSPDLQLIDITPIPDGMTLPTGATYNKNNNSSPWRLAEREGIIYACDVADGNANIWTFNPETREIGSLIPEGAEVTDYGAITYNDVFVGSNATGICFTGSGASTRLWMYSKDYPRWAGSGTTKPALIYWNIGTDEKITHSPQLPADKTDLRYTGGILEDIVELSPTHGGVLISQETSTDTDRSPAFIFIDSQGNIKHKSTALSGTSFVNNCSGAIVCDKDESTMVVSLRSDGTTDNGLRVYDMEWDNGSISLSNPWNVPNSYNYGALVSQLSLDAADNIYAFYTSPANVQAGFIVFSIKREHPKAICLAPDDCILKGYDFGEEYGKRGEFAYSLSVSDQIDNSEEDGHTFNFSLTGAADVYLNLKNLGGGQNLQFHIGECQKGKNSYALPAGALGQGTTDIYEWNIEVHSKPIPKPYLLYSTAKGDLLNARGGLQIIKDPSSPMFGFIVTATGMGNGFRLYKPDITPYHLSNPYYNYGASYKDNRNSPFRLGQLAGQIYAADWNNGQPITKFNPQTPTSDIRSAMPNVASGNTFYLNGNRLMSSSTSVAFQTVTNANDETVDYMWAYVDGVHYLHNEETDTYYTYGEVVRYPFDRTTGKISGAPVVMNSNLTSRKYLNNTNVCLTPVKNGIFISQKRRGYDTNDRYNNPEFLYIDYNGNIKFNSASIPDLQGCAIGLAINDDESLMAISETYGQIAFYDITWENNVPSFTRRAYTLASEADAAFQEHSQMAFDPAGNLYTYRLDDPDYPTDDQNGLYVYSVPQKDLTDPNDHPIAFTPSPTGQNVFGPYAEEIITGDGDRGHYAYDLRMTQEGDYPTHDRYAKLEYKITGDSPCVRIWVQNTTAGESYVYDMGGQRKGTHTFYLDTKGLYGNRRFSWKVEVRSAPVKESNRITHESPLYNTGGYDSETGGGVQVIKDPDSPLYGYIVASFGYGEGLRLYNPLHELIGTYPAPSDNATASTNPWARYKDSPFKLAQRGGKIYVADLSDSKTDYLYLDPVEAFLNPERTDWVHHSMMPEGAYRNSIGLWKNSAGNEIASSSQCLGFSGEGENTVMWAYLQDITYDGMGLIPEGYADDHKYGCLVKYDIGTSDIIPEFTRVDEVSCSNIHLWLNNHASIHPGLDGGIFISQNRAEGNNQRRTPSFVYVDREGEVRFNAGESMAYPDDAPDYINGSGTGITLTADLKYLIMPESTHGLRVFEVTWGEGQLKSGETVRLPISFRRLEGYEVGNSENFNRYETCQLDTDPGSNVYAFHRNANSTISGLSVYTIETKRGGVEGYYYDPGLVHDPLDTGDNDGKKPAPRLANEELTLYAPIAVTPAPASMLIHGTSQTTQLDMPTTYNPDDYSDAEIIYYNLQGVRMPADNLAPGFYIKVQGNLSEKVYIK